MTLTVVRVKMLNDEKELHMKRAVFLPMYYTVISLMVRKDTLIF